MYGETIYGIGTPYVKEKTPTKLSIETWETIKEFVLKPNWKPRMHYYLDILISPIIRSHLREFIPKLSMYDLAKLMTPKETLNQSIKAHAFRTFATYWRTRLYAQYIYIYILKYP